VVDVMHGTGSDYLNALFDSAVMSHMTINKNKGTMFLAASALESVERNLSELLSVVKKELYRFLTFCGRGCGQI
jgi:phosphomannomutase